MLGCGPVLDRPDCDAQLVGESPAQRVVLPCTTKQVPAAVDPQQGTRSSGRLRWAMQPDASAGRERDYVHVIAPTGKVHRRERAQQRQGPTGNRWARREPGNPSQVGVKVFARHGSNPYFNDGLGAMRSLALLCVAAVGYRHSGDVAVGPGSAPAMARRRLSRRRVEVERTGMAISPRSGKGGSDVQSARSYLDFASHLHNHVTGGNTCTDQP
jgi:hypothetical protein